MAEDDADPFLVGADEDEVVDERTVSMCSPKPRLATSAEQTTPGKPGRPKKGATQTEQSPTKRKRTSRHGCKQKLSAMEPKSDVEFMPTVFVQPSAKKKGAKPAKVNTVPVTLWPQYSINGVDGTFLVVSASELWFQKMLKTIRCRSDDQTLRRLTANVMYQLKILLRTILGNAVESDNKADVCEDDVQEKPKQRTWSGFRLCDVLLLQKSWGTTKPTLVNTGEVMILLLDEEGTKFICEVIVLMIHQVTLEAPVSEFAKKETKSGSMWSFENETPNIRDKVVWDPDCESFKLLQKGEMTTYVDHEGVPLTVRFLPGDDEKSYMAKKAEAHRRAILSWNFARRKLPSSKQHLIPEIALYSLREPAPSTPDVIVCSSHDSPDQTTDEALAPSLSSSHGSPDQPTDGALAFSLLSSDDSPAQESKKDTFV